MIRTETDDKGVVFEIDDNGTLANINLKGCKEVYIPHKTAGGLTIDRVKANVFKKYAKGNTNGKVKNGILKIVLGEGISQVSAYMLEGVEVPIDFTWNSTCERIPSQFFKEKNLVKLSGIENVKEVGSEAFCNSTITDIDWPKGCTMISMLCFAGSGLDTITGIENVTDIEEGAFFGCPLFHAEFKWPKKVKTIPKSCFALSGIQGISGIEKVTVVEQQAFSGSEIVQIDFSKSAVKKIKAGAFDRTKKLREVTWPPNCDTISKMCFFSSEVYEVKNLSAVENIEEEAFYGSFVRKLDFSGSQLLSIGFDALPKGNKHTKIIPPYYDGIMNQENIYYEQKEDLGSH